jgi:pantoate--beta-alanine ligase
VTGQIGAPPERLLTPPVVRDRDALSAARDGLPGPVAVVMTMGALHAGHAALLRQARARAASVIATIFVNPLQFAPTEDLDRYPRTLDADLEICAKEQVDLVFAPTVDVMYPTGQPEVRVQPGPRGDILEGTFRPGFFSGVLTVVSKLLHLTRPDATFFGEKDYQQLVMVRQMVTDLSMDIEVVGVPIVREPDGLALSSRNAYLSPDERTSGLALSAALRAGVQVSDQGADAVLKAANKILSESTVDVDYCELTDPALGPVPEQGPARLLIAARVGATRLIDNTALRLGH